MKQVSGTSPLVVPWYGTLAASAVRLVIAEARSAMDASADCVEARSAHMYRLLRPTAVLCHSKVREESTGLVLRCRGHCIAVQNGFETDCGLYLIS